MNKNILLHTEKTETSQFVVAQFDSFEQLINYQVKMLTNNKIKYLLRATLQQMNNEINIYYDVSGKVSLREYKNSALLTDTQFLGIIKSVINADDEIEEFQLVNSGIVLSDEWAYVDIDGNNIEFVYVPNAGEPNDAGEVREFLLEIIKGNYVENTNQAFLSAAYALLSDANMSIIDLKELVYKFENGYEKKSMQKNTQEDFGAGRTENANREDYAKEISMATKKTVKSMVPSKPSFMSKSETAKSKINIPKSKNIPSAVSLKTTEKFKAKRGNDMAGDMAEMHDESIEKKSTLPVTLFVVGNIFVTAIVYKIYTMGLFVAENGGFDPAKLGVVALAWIAVDVIAAKNIFFGKAEKTEKAKKEKVKKEKKVKTPKEKAVEPRTAVEVPNAKPETPKVFKPSKKSEPPKAFTVPKSVEAAEAFETPKPVEIPKTAEKQKPVEAPKPVEVSKLSETHTPDDLAEVIRVDNEQEIYHDKTVLMENSDFEDIGYDETVLMVNSAPLGYIERLENNVVEDKYIIKKDRIIIGRLRSQVDMTVLNPKVGKIHAEISHTDGKFYIRDICSKNGTYMGNSHDRIKTDCEYELKDGDRFKLADSEFQIHIV